MFLDWSQAERDGDPDLTEVSLGSSEEKKAERAEAVLEAGSGWAGLEDRGRLSGTELSFTEPW